MIFNLPECQIKHVTVHPQGARVTRIIKLAGTSPAGSHQIKVSGFSSDCNTSTIRITGTTSCQINEITTEHVQKRRDEIEFDYAETTQKEIQALVADLKQFERDSAKLQRTAALVDEKKVLLKTHIEHQLSSTPSGGFQDFKMANSQSVLQLLDSYTTGAELADAEALRIIDELDDIRKNVMKTVKRLEDLIGGPMPLSQDDKGNCAAVLKQLTPSLSQYETISMHVAKFDVSLPEAASNIELDMIYDTYNASWQPCYDVRASLQGGPLSLVYFGKVTQNTKEDWNNVTLLLSTANIHQDRVPPTLPTHIVSFKESAPPTPAPVHGRRMMMMKSANGAEGFGASCSVQSSAGGTSVVYKVPRDCSVASDNCPHKLPVAELELPCTFIRYAVPSSSPAVFLLGQVVNSSPYHILMGHDASVYLDEAYVGKTNITKTITPDETFHLPLTVDPSITITHLPEKKFGKATGMMSKGRHETRETVSHVSFGVIDPKQKLVVLSALPASSDAQIIVKLIDPTTTTELDEATDAGAAVRAIAESGNSTKTFINKAKNHLLSVIPMDKAKAVVRVSYSIEWPADKEIETVRK